MLLMLSMLHGFAIAFLFTAANTMFLSRFGVEQLPYVYLFASAAVIIAGLVCWRYQSRLGAARFFPRVLIFACVTMLLFAVGLWQFPGLWVWYFGLMAWDKLMQMLVGLEFASLSSLLFDLRQSKRLFGLISAGEVVASVAGYLLVPVIVSYFGATMLVLLAAVFFALAWGFLVIILRRNAAKIPGPDFALPRRKHSIHRMSLMGALKEKYVLMICIMAGLSVSAFYIIDFGFLREVKSQSLNIVQLAFFFGIFFAAGDIVNIIIRLFFTGRIIDKFGIRTGLLVLPITLFAVTAAAVFSAQFMGGASQAAVMLILFMGANRMFDTILRTSLQEPSGFILYQPMKSRDRIATHTLADGLVEPLAMGATGVLILLLIRGGVFTPAHVNYYLLGILAAWIVASVILSREYIRSLLRAMKTRILDGNANLFTDAASREAIRMKLQSPYPEEIVYALDLLEKLHSHALPVYIEELLSHTSNIVRIDAITRIQRLKIESAIPRLLKCIEPENPVQLRAAAIQAYCALREEKAIEMIAPYLDDHEPEIRAGAITGLLRYGGIDGILLAANNLLDLSASSQPVRRQRAATIIGDVGASSFDRILRTLAADPDPGVQKSAIFAAARIKNEKMIPMFIDALSRPHTHSVAVAALVSTGSAALPHIAAAFRQPGVSGWTAARLLRVAGRIRGEGAITFLKERIEYPDVVVRNQALASLSQSGYRADENEINGIHGAIDSELSYAYWYLVTMSQLEVNPVLNLLYHALEIELDQIRERVFYLLSFLYEPKTVLRARDNLRLHSPERRAYALESLDVQLPGELKRKFFPLIDHIPLRDRISRLAGHFSHSNIEPDIKERLQNIIVGPQSYINPWSKSCTIHLAVILELRDLLDDIIGEFGSNTMHVNETVLHAVNMMAPERLPSLQNVAQEIKQPSPFIQNILFQRDNPMLLTIEKVIMLKTIDMFSETPDDVLVEVASILEEELFSPGDVIIRKGEPGNCMYLIREGKVRVHDGDLAIAELGARDIFGEFSLLDTESRSASVTAIEPAYTLRMDQDAFYELMADRIEVGKGIIRVLTRRLRKQNQMLADMKKSVK